MALKKAPGKLTLVPTPIGNLKDITLRALETLKETDYIAAETVSRTRKLLSHYQIRPRHPLLSFREENRRSAAAKIIELLKKGKSLALVSDAGTPGISDPGFYLLEKVREQELPVEVLPGPTAVIPALLLSGFNPEKFCFLGFLPRKTAERKEILKNYTNFEGVLVLFEAPNRILALLEDLKQILPENPVCLVREISKIYQEVIKGKPGELRDQYSGKKSPRGEWVILIQCQKGRGEQEQKDWEQALKMLLEKGMSCRDATDFLSKFLGISRKIIYRLMKDKQKISS